MLRAPLRTLPRALPRRPIQPAPQLRNVSTGSTQRRFAVYQSQTTNPVVYASLGLAALLGWTAAILTVGGKNGKRAEKIKGSSPLPHLPLLGSGGLAPLSARAWAAGMAQELL